MTKKAKKDESSKKTNDKISELTDSLKRLQAEFDNFRKRTDQERVLISQAANASFAKELLTILDNFELALKQSDNSPFAQGIELVYSQFMQLLEEQGLKLIKAESFDPQLHEALLSEPSSQPKGEILEVMQKGFLFYDKVLRLAKVKVSGGKQNE